MHPIRFKEKWDLTYEEMTLVLGYESYDTIRAWGRKTGKNQREPMRVVYTACYLLNEKWEREGKGKQLVALCWDNTAI